MKAKNESIETLLERFFEGQTSNEEEQRLYLFFRQKTIPEELVQFKPVIKYFENGLADELGCSVQQPVRPSPISNSRKRWILWSGIAASFLIILNATLFFLKATETHDPYEGSYIIRNGLRITDLDLIRPELEVTLQSILQQQEELEQLLAQLTEMESLDIRILQQIEANNQQILASIQDENIRKEVEKILY